MSQPARIVLALLIGLAIWFAVRAHSQTDAIQWHWQNGRLFERYSNSRTLQFGLRPDGVVVWRELVAITNSPAEGLATNRFITSPPPLPQ